VLVVNRFRVSGAQDVDGRDVTASGGRAAAQFADAARAALEAFAACPGFTDGRLGRSADDPSWWCLVTRWESVGAYRRALGSLAVKVAATPLLAEAVEEPAAFEVMAEADPGGPVRSGGSDRAPDAGTAAVGDLRRQS
jgi:heme oxygenase (mycobilin-producing)